jgi:hypothetical protein
VSSTWERHSTVKATSVLILFVILLAAFNKERPAIMCVDETLFRRMIYAQAARTLIFRPNRRRPS